ncbi:hypothetical protein RSOLAG22IIIB_10814 [Rhizoctonia solani]|uniref:Uncharacterized protein n=1 Tax=Rhizoctonia solani TaxID=456999 RepID=A0A0K6G507_9AGAM|nr:hypothetical protein RSOLAG22IIIB_10814 [Rhizoctonia solani]
MAKVVLRAPTAKVVLKASTLKDAPKHLAARRARRRLTAKVVPKVASAKNVPRADAPKVPVLTRKARAPISVGRPPIKIRKHIPPRTHKIPAPMSPGQKNIPKAPRVTPKKNQTLTPKDRAPLSQFPPNLLVPLAVRVHPLLPSAMTPVEPKTPNPSAEDKFADWQDRTPQAGDKAGTPYSAVIPLTPHTGTPKTVAGVMTPKTQTGAMTPRTPGGRYGKALSEASTAPTSAEGLMRQRISREVVTSVPVPSESEAITLGHHGHGQEPMRISALWYLNVHAPPPFEWLRTQAVLYPNVLILTWIAPIGGRGVVTLDLVNCTEPSPSHPSARDDVGSVAARLQSADLAETLCPFQLLYTDGVERLDTPRRRVRWVRAIWDVLATIARGPPRALTDGSESESGTLQRSSSVRSHSSEGSATTSFVAPAVDSADTASVIPYVPRETADDMSVASLVPPSRAPSSRRTASMADLELEADIDRALGRTPAPASSSSEEDSNFLSPPRSRSRVSGSDRSGYRTPTTDRARSSRYSASNVTGQEDTCVPTDTEQSTVRGVRIVADSISFRGSSSARGDTYDALSTGYGSTGRSESVVSTVVSSRRRTLSGLSSSGSGLSRSHGLRRPKRERTLSVSPAASRRQSLAIEPSDSRSESSGSYNSFQTRSELLSGSQAPSTYGFIAYEVCETSDMSEFTIDQTGSRARTVIWCSSHTNYLMI